MKAMVKISIAESRVGGQMLGVREPPVMEMVEEMPF